MLVAPQISSADILVGISDWTTVNDPSDPTKVTNSASNVVDSNVNVNLYASGLAPGGSNDQTWGDTSLTPTPPQFNGTAVGDFSLKIGATSAVTLGQLVFDAISYQPGASLTVSYLITPGGGNDSSGTGIDPISNPSFHPLALTSAPNNPNVPHDSTGAYTGYTVPLGNLLVPAGSTIEFFFAYTGGLITYTDNLAVTAVPEPGSLLGLGCVVGAGAFLRSRRRK